MNVEIVVHHDIHGQRSGTRLVANAGGAYLNLPVSEARVLWSQLGHALATIDEQAVEVAP